MTYIIYSIQSKAKEVDKKIKSHKAYYLFNKLKFTYILFLYSPKEFILKQLYLKHLNNI